MYSRIRPECVCCLSRWVCQCLIQQQLWDINCVWVCLSSSSAWWDVTECCQGREAQSLRFRDQCVRGGRCERLKRLKPRVASLLLQVGQSSVGRAVSSGDLLVLLQTGGRSHPSHVTQRWTSSTKISITHSSGRHEWKPPALNVLYNIWSHFKHSCSCVVTPSGPSCFLRGRVRDQTSGRTEPGVVEALSNQ